MAHNIPLDPAGRAANPQYDQVRNDGSQEIVADLAYRRLALVNVVYFGKPNAGDRQWVLIDAGIPGTSGLIAAAAEERFGPQSRPAAIILTHGHFDHVGALIDLADRWDAPIYAHELERPYLDGTTSYPPPDPSVGGGLLATLSPLFPAGPVNASKRLQPLPADGTVPHMPGWVWVHTPGHTPGHVSFWRGADRTVIAGDAFITTTQESAYSVAMQIPAMHGPPMYFTPDWAAARSSVECLAALEPDLAVTGHGPAMRGDEMLTALHTLATDFDCIAVPKQGKYVHTSQNATTNSGHS